MASVPQPVTLLAAQTITANTTGPPVALPAGSLGKTAAVLLAVTAVSGTTPTADVRLQWSLDGINFYDAEPPDTFTQKTAAGGSVKVFTVKGGYAQVAVTLGGTTPSFTLSVTGLVDTDRTV